VCILTRLRHILFHHDFLKAGVIEHKRQSLEGSSKLESIYRTEICRRKENNRIIKELYELFKKFAYNDWDERIEYLKKVRYSEFLRRVMFEQSDSILFNRDAANAYWISFEESQLPEFTTFCRHKDLYNKFMNWLKANGHLTMVAFLEQHDNGGNFTYRPPQDFGNQRFGSCNSLSSLSSLSSFGGSSFSSGMSSNISGMSDLSSLSSNISDMSYMSSDF